LGTNILLLSLLYLNITVSQSVMVTRKLYRFVEIHPSSNSIIDVYAAAAAFLVMTVHQVSLLMQLQCALQGHRVSKSSNGS